MKVLSFLKEDNTPSYWNEVMDKSRKLILYLEATKDENLIKDSEIERIEIYDQTFVKIYLKNEMFVFDFGSIEMLRTHHYIYKSKYHKEEVEKLWSLIDGKIDWFVIEDWFVKNRMVNYNYSKDNKGVTYDKDFIYVNGKSTGIKFTSDLLSFVFANREKWS